MRRGSWGARAGTARLTENQREARHTGVLERGGLTVGSLTSRGRALVVVAFVVSAALCGSAALALVVASRDDAVAPLAIPSSQPGLPLETSTPTSSPTPVVVSTPTVAATSTPAPTATTTPAPSASPRASVRVTSSPSGDWTGTGTAGGTGTGSDAQPLLADASLDPADGDTTTDTVFHLFSHATDGEGAISLLSLTWGDGTSATPGTRGTACTATAPADCRDFAWTHRYAAVNKDGYQITLKLQSGTEIFTLKIKAYVNGA